MPKRVLSLAIAFTILLFTLVPPIAGFWVSKELGRRLKLEVTGKYKPVLFSTSFKLQDARIDWKNRVQLKNGNLRIGYSLGTLLRHGRLRIRLQGKQLPIELLGDWAKIQGVNAVTLDSLDADLELDCEGLREIHEIHANSSKFQFHIQKSGV